MGLNLNSIKKALTRKDTDIVVLGVTDSTNNEAKRRIAAGFASNSLIVAERQTAGRGRQGKSFFSMCKGAIYMTAVFAMTREDPARVTIAAAVAVAKAIEDAEQLYPRIKWVNDLFYHGKKIGGILSEAVDGHIIIGIGINTNAEAEEFPTELQAIVGGIPLKTPREKLIAAIYNKLCEYLNTDYKKIIKEYRARSLMDGKTVIYLQENREIAATVLGIDDKGRLIVKTEDGKQECLSSGEVNIINHHI